MERKLSGLFCVCFCGCVSVHMGVCIHARLLIYVGLELSVFLWVYLCVSKLNRMYICVFSMSVRTQGPCNQHWVSAWQGHSPPLSIVRPLQPELKTTSRTKWVNSVWHVFNMVTLEQAAFDWKANIQAMQIINHGKRPINYSIKQSNSRINVEKRREGWGGSQQKWRKRESG